jgi:hypothetical protein
MGRTRYHKDTYDEDVEIFIEKTNYFDIDQEQDQSDQNEKKNRAYEDILIYRISDLIENYKNNNNILEYLSVSDLITDRDFRIFWSSNPIDFNLRELVSNLSRDIYDLIQNYIGDLRNDSFNELDLDRDLVKYLNLTPVIIKNRIIRSIYRYHIA